MAKMRDVLLGLLVIISLVAACSEIVAYYVSQGLK